MALATVAQVRQTGGLNDADAYRLFLMADEGELDDQVADELDVASAFMQERISTTYYTGSPTANTGRDKLFRKAECLFALHFLTLPLKVRKVEGTQWAVLQEDSSRFAELIDQEFLAQAELLIDQYATIDTASTPFALPTIGATDDFDRETELLSVDVRNRQLIDESQGLVGVAE